MQELNTRQLSARTKMGILGFMKMLVYRRVELENRFFNSKVYLNVAKIHKKARPFFKRQAVL
jgi:hypothetical protein